MDLTKESIEQWFDRTYPGCKILEFDLASSEQFNLVARCWHGNIAMDKFCKLFIDRFSAFTLTNWTVSSTFPKIRRILFRKDYRCHLTGGNKKRELQRMTSRNKGCSATIVLRFKKINKNTMKNDRLLRDELNVEIQIKFQHSHSIRTLESYNLLRCTQRTKERYLEFFNMGIPTIEAKMLNEIYIRLTYYDPKEREIHLANGMINVNYTKILHLHYEWVTKNRHFKFDSFSRLKQEKDTFESMGFYLKIVENPKIIVVLTPLTKKAFKKYGEEIFIDSSGVTGKEIQYVTSIFVPTKVGAIPIGYVIHDGHTEQEYEQGFKVLAASLNEFCDKPLRPKVVMTNDGDQLEELGRIFPTCVIELCQFTNLTKFWTFIWDANNNIYEEDRKRLMTKYYGILTSQSTDECENLFREIMTDPQFSKNPSLVQLLNQFWVSKENWCKIKTENRSQNNDILTSTHMRVYKEIVLRKIQKFNAYVIVKLLTEVMEGMYKRYLMRFSLKGTAKCPLFAVFYDKPVSYNILPVCQNEYMVQSLTELDQVCTVYTDIMYCTCGNPTEGKKGAYCVHLCAVEFEFPFLPYPSMNDDEKEFYRFPELRNEVLEAIDNFERIDDNVTCERKPAKKKHRKIPLERLLTSEEIKTEPSPEVIISSDHTEDNKVLASSLPIDYEKAMNSTEHYQDNELMDSSEHIEDNELIASSEHTEYNEVMDHSKRSGTKNYIVPKIRKSETKTRKRARRRTKEYTSCSDNEKDDTSPRTSALKRDSRRSTSDDEAEIVSKTWGLVYKRLTTKQKLYAKKAIDDILFEATLGTLGRNSVTINQNAQTSDIDPIGIKNDYSD